MDHDWFWISATIALDLANAAGYALIAIHWWRMRRLLPKVPAKSALGNIRNIFVFCGICGYLFIPDQDVLAGRGVFTIWYWRCWFFIRGDMLEGPGTEGDLQRDWADDKTSRGNCRLPLEESRRKSLFLNALSHDLRTPLNGLVLQANLAEPEPSGYGTAEEGTGGSSR